MHGDKQLSTVRLDEVLEKRRLGQALNAKEFAVVAGVSYSAAREWFRLPGFPVFRGLVFWQDFERWRATQTGLNEAERGSALNGTERQHQTPASTPRRGLPPQAARIVAQFG